MTIKLNEYDKRLLSQITPSSKWDKLKSIYAINSVIKQLKIGNKKIGTKCAKHLQKLSKLNTTSLQEIKEGCRDLKIPKQKLPLAKDKTKREVESVHKINKVTDKAPTDKTKGGRKGGGGGGGGKAQPQADLIGGLFTAFKAQEAKQARDTQYNQLAAQMKVDQQIPQGAAGDALRQRMQGPAAQQYLDALKETSSITGLSEGERLLYQQLLNDRQIAQQAQLYNVSGDYSMKSDSVNLLNQLENKIYRAREQDLSGFSLPPTPRSVFTASSQISNDTLTPRTISTDSGSNEGETFVSPGIGLFAPLGITPQTSLQSEVKKKSFESEKLRNIDDEFTKMNKLRTQIEQGVKEGKITPKEASEGLQQVLEQKELNEALKASTETIRMQTNIIGDIQRYNKLAAPKEAQENLGFQSLTKKLQNRENELEKNRLLNQLIINSKEQKQKQIEDTLGNLQVGVMDRTSGLAEQQTIFNQRSQPQLGLTRTQSGDIIKQSDLQRTLSAPTVQSLDIGRAERKLREQQESEAIFNRKQQELASEVQDIQRTESLLERMERDAKRSLSEISSDEFALPKQEPPVMAFGQEEKSLEEKQNLQNLLTQLGVKEEIVKERFIDTENLQPDFKMLQNTKEVKYINRGDRKIRVDALTGERLGLSRTYNIGDEGVGPGGFNLKSKIPRIKEEREIYKAFTEKEKDLADDKIIQSKLKNLDLFQNKKQRVEQEFLENKDKPNLGSWMGPSFSRDLGGGTISEENRNKKIEKFDKEQEPIKEMLDRLDIEYE